MFKADVTVATPSLVLSVALASSLMKVCVGKRQQTAEPRRPVPSSGVSVVLMKVRMRPLSGTRLMT
jgi:hypothetical protein